MLSKERDKAASHHLTYLFTIYSRQITIDALGDVNGSMKVGAKTVTNFGYADDFVIIAGTIEEPQDMVNKLNVESNRFGLTVNTSKVNNYF
eukprot:gene12556-3251_t